MKVNPDCTLSDVGRAAGVSKATASMALRQDPRIKRETRQKVHQAAKRLGYRPDPVLSSLVARRVRGRRATANLAALIDDRWAGARQTGWMQVLLSGMSGAAGELGYHIDELFLERDLHAAGSPDRLLRTRGIRGLVLLPVQNAEFRLELDFRSYALVAISRFAIGSRAHRAGSDAFAGMQLICDQVAALGYKRIGLAHALEVESRLRYEWLGGLAKEHFLRGSPFVVVSPFLPGGQMEETRFLAWVRRSRPDCIVTNDDRLPSWLRNAGLRIPADIGVVFINRDIVDHPNPSGIAQHFDAIGRSAIEQLHTSLQRGELGFPRVQKEILIRPHWVRGATLRKQ